MEQTKNNQERSRKYGGSSSFVEAAEPSKAPRQDEDAREFVGPSDRDQAPAYNSSRKQGVSNRPANVEDAVPESGKPRTDTTDTGETTPKQQGGNRGGV